MPEASAVRPINEEILVGSIWRERARAYNRRTVRVVSVHREPPGAKPFVQIETVTGLNGLRPARPYRSNVRLNTWHRRYAQVKAEGRQS